MLRHLPKLKRHPVTSPVKKTTRSRMFLPAVMTGAITALAGTIGGILLRRKNKKEEQSEGPESLLRPDASSGQTHKGSRGKGRIGKTVGALVGKGMPNESEYQESITETGPGSKKKPE